MTDRASLLKGLELMWASEERDSERATLLEGLDTLRELQRSIDDHKDNCDEKRCSFDWDEETLTYG